LSATVFLGGGRITSALVAGLRLAGYRKPIVVHDLHVRKLRQLRRRYGVRIESNLSRAVSQADILSIAVRPDSVDKLLEEIGSTRHPLTAVSLAAGVTLARLRARLGPPVRWARAMPSPVCGKGRGLTAIAFERSVSMAGRRQVQDLFATVGSVLEIPESKFDAFTVTYSPSHGYHALATLASAAENLGLPRKIALASAAHALADAICFWRETETSLAELLSQAATPGGIAATVMSSMDASGYKRLLQRSLRKGILRARRNA
jgi:pyrroline-5-carboxylate reductase